ncbi:MAG: O-antigen ligase family protein [Oscillospiraceae bacterium]|nr:O-antigen ligase family protein [Oscillospiraceae bacterium]
MRTIKLTKITAAFEYLLVLIVIINNYTMFQRDVYYNFSESRLCLVFSFLCIGIVFLRCMSGAIRFNSKYLLAIIMLTGFSFLTTIVPGGQFIPGTVKWSIPFMTCSFFCACHEDTKTLWARFANVMFIIASLSLFLFISGTILQIIPPTRSAKFLYDGDYVRANTYYNFQYEAQRVQGAGFFGIQYRNCCFFIEAPMYNLMLCLAFAAEAGLRKKPRIVVLAVLAASILSTFSTTGILFLMAMIVLYLWNTGKAPIIRFLKIAMIPAAIGTAAYIAYYLIQTKQNTSAGGESFSVRLDHLVACLKMFIHRPLLGYGFGNSDAFYAYTKYKQGFSIGLPAFLGFTGLPLFLLYLLPFINRVITSLRNNRAELLFWIGTFICFFLTASVYKLIFLFLMCTQIMWKDDSSGKNVLYSKIQEALKIS